MLKDQRSEEFVKTHVNLSKIQEYLRKFIADRNWDCYRTPKNLATALSVEASELLEIFQWDLDSDPLNTLNDSDKMQRIEEEVADVFSYLIQICDVLNIDLEESFWRKSKLNEKKHVKN